MNVFLFAIGTMFLADGKHTNHTHNPRFSSGTTNRGCNTRDCLLRSLRHGEEVTLNQVIGPDGFMERTAGSFDLNSSLNKALNVLKGTSK